MERKQISSKLKKEVWLMYHHTSLTGPCYIGCGKHISFFEGYECGHVISVKNGGPTELENLKPICFDCNRSMGKMNMADFVRNKSYVPLDDSIFDLPYMDIEFYGAECDHMLKSGKKCRNKKKNGPYCLVHTKT